MTDPAQIVKKTAEELRHDKNYSERVQAYYDSYHESKKKKKPLKTWTAGQVTLRCVTHTYGSTERINDQEVTVPTPKRFPTMHVD